MSKKFKHLPTGDIYTKFQQVYFKNNNALFTNLASPSIPEFIVEAKDSKDWEEVKEKTYRITKIRNVVNDIIVFTKDKIYFEHLPQGSLSCTTEALLKLNCKIEEVERLKDGEIFTIGDETKHGKIVSFVENNESIQVNMVSDHTTNQHLEYLVKKPKVLFKTTDGVEITMGSRVVFWVDKEFKDKGRLIASQFVFNQDVYTFNTEKARDEFILYNTPCLSIEDIAKVYTTANIRPHNSVFSYKQSEKLLNIVKTKLGK